MNKQELSERDVCIKYIVTALERAGWDRMLQMRATCSQLLQALLSDALELKRRKNYVR